MEVTPVLVIPRTKERSAESPVRDRLRDRRFACPGKPVQPVDLGCARAPGPVFDLVQNGYTGPLETSLAVAMSKLCPERRAEAIEDSCFICERFVSGTYH